MIPTGRIPLRSCSRRFTCRTSITPSSCPASSSVAVSASSRAKARSITSTPVYSSRNKGSIDTKQNQLINNRDPSNMPSSNLRSPQQQQRPLATAATSSSSSSFPNPQPFHSLPPGYTIHQSLPSSSSQPVAIFDKPLEVSSLDDRSYRLITLQNGLEVLLIHDPNTDKASAAMDVRVGHLSDPLELQGLAHFCEHLLFMGTKKYPRENEYSEYLSQHSGSSNAYTGMENTNYFFDVGHNHLEGALDRFAQFFLEPLFDPSCSEREIRAVDSEHKKNLQSDAWRAFQLEKSLSDPNHPYSHFGTGNAKTLWDDPKKQGLDVRDELLKFHDRYYSANVMKLVVLGRESLDQLTSWVVEKFSGVRNKGLAAPTFPSSPLGPSQLQTEVFFRTVKDIRMLDVTFPIPDQGPQFRAKPGQLLSHFIGHEGQGSILSYLKAQGWANHLSAGATNGADGFEFFKISVDLTESGLANYDKVVASMFKYLDLLRSSSVEKWAFDEVQQLCELAYRFKEKSPPSSYASGLSSQMQQPYPREWILSGPYLTREFDLDLVQKTLQCLSPEKCRVFVAAQQLPDGSKIWDSKERWYGTEYKLQPLNSSLRTFKANDFEGLSLPKPNSFIPTNFEVEGAPQNKAQGAAAQSEKKQVGKPSKRPILIRNDPLARVWHKKDDQFFLPKANIFLLLRTPLIDATPANAVKSRLLVELIKDALTEYSYDAELAGLAYNIEAQADGIGFSLDGYNDKLPVLAKYIMEEVAKFKVEPSRFEVVKDQVSRAYENFHLEAPYQHANYYTTYLLNERMWTAEEKLKELAGIQPEDVQRYLPDILERLHIEMLAHGNIKKQEALDLTQMAVDILGPKPLSPSELVSPRSLILPKGSSTLWEKSVANPENVNSSIEYFCHVGDPSDIHLRASLALLAQIAQEPCFDQLRTKEQLGYLVFSSVRKTIGMMGFRILVQSERDAPYVEGRIDAFLDTLKDLLTKMTGEEFESQKMSLIQKKKEVVKNLYEETSRYWFHIHSGYYDFFQRDLDVEALKKINKEEVLDLFMRFIHPSSQERSKLSVHLNSKVKPIRFSTKAAEVLEKETSEKGLPVPKEAFELLKSQQPNVEIVKEHTAQSLSAKEVGASPEVIDSVLKRIDQLAQEHPLEAGTDLDESAESASKSKIPVKKVSEEDTIAFKAGLPPSKAAVPVHAWSYYQKDFDEKEVPQIEESATKANL